MLRVDTGGDIEGLVALQQHVRLELAKLGIVIEANPSSNLLIGHYADLRQHPLWRIMPVVPSAELHPLPLCIGTDDPITFNTHLRQEYQALYDGLRAAGFTEIESRTWLNGVREHGLNARFTVRCPGGMTALSRMQAEIVFPSVTPRNLPGDCPSLTEPAE